VHLGATLANENISCKNALACQACGSCNPWCEYKLENGVDFDSYAIYQYEYARDYAGCLEWDL